MPFDRKILQRAFLAFTTGLFLACAARVSAADAATSDSAARRLGGSAVTTPVASQPAQ
jgi:hypothetical protein